MSTSTPTIMIASFRLRRDYVEQWLEARRRVAAQAKRREACRLFRLFRDPDDETHYASISEWDSRSAFNAFARDSGFIWMEEELAYSCTPRSTPSSSRSRMSPIPLLWRHLIGS